MSESGQRYSLKRRLLLSLLATIAVVWVAAAAYSYWDARHEVSELLDAHLAQSASLIAAQVREGLDEIDLEHAPQVHERGRRVAFQVWDRGKVLQLHSSNAPDGRFSARDEGFSDAVIAGRTWRVFSSWDPGRRYLVQVGERDEARREIAARVAGNLLLPLLIALPALALFAWLSIARALVPLGRLREELRQRQPDQLAALSAPDAPAEVAPLVDTLNSLFARVTRTIENERRFTADAAHELRTPLAALKTQAQVALGAEGDEDRLHALRQVVAGCDRAARLVEQLLTLARLEPTHFSGQPQPCDLRQLARQAVGEAAPAALARGMEIELEEGDPLPLRAYPDLVSVLLRNLLDNAVRYGSGGNRIRVRVSLDATAASIGVSDEGPGIPRDQRTKVGQRFYRIPGTGQSGTGLGLSIVKRIAELHHGAVELDDGENGRGLSVRVRLARA